VRPGATWLWLAVAALAAGCGGDASLDRRVVRPPWAFTRLLIDEHWRLEGAELPNDRVEAVEICGDVRPGFVVDAGATLECDCRLPAEPFWLDVECALLPEQGAPAGPPPPARLVVSIRHPAGESLLHDGFPYQGTPPTAFGFGRARIEIREGLGGDATLVFRVLGAGSEPRRAVLAGPRLSPRVTAHARAALRVDLRIAHQGPVPREPEFAATFPGLAQLVADGALDEAAAGDRRIGAVPLDDDLLARAAGSARAPDRLVLGFGAFAPGAALPPGFRLFDALALTDPFRFDPLEPIGPSLAGTQAAWDEELLRDRARALGEHSLFRELAMPRRGQVHVIVVTHGSGDADAALVRLVSHLRANELWDSAELAVHLVGDGDPPAGIRTFLRAPGRAEPGN
jgi:hypothetical protein